MRAVRLIRPGAPLQIQEVDTPAPDSDELLIQLEACGVCHTDLHLREGEEAVDPALLPMTLGHEGIGRVVAMGKRVDGFVLGQRVGAPWLHDTCLACRECLDGHESICAAQRAHGMHVPGAFADYMVVKAAFAASIPESLDPVVAAPLLCAGLTAYGAVNKASLKPGRRCAIFGCGGLGQYAILLARMAGASVIAIDNDTARLAVARSLGADTCLVSDADTGAALQAMGGVESCINFAPTAAIWPAVEQGLKPRGRFVSVAMPNEPVALSLAWLTWVTPVVTGSAVGGRQALADFLSLAVQRPVQIPVEAVRLTDVDAALDRLKNPGRSNAVAGRLVVDFRLN